MKIESEYDMEKAEELNLDFLEGAMIQKIGVRNGGEYLNKLVIITDKGYFNLSTNINMEHYTQWNEIEICDYDN